MGMCAANDASTFDFDFGYQTVPGLSCNVWHRPPIAPDFGGAGRPHEFGVIADSFCMSRNPYDRLGHLAQGFVPALIARELLLRTSPLRQGKWLFTLVTCMCLAISAFYELIEWWAAIGTGEAAEDFLGTQGDVWDTQWDMFLALTGAVVAQVTLARVHDRQLEALEGA